MEGFDLSLTPSYKKLICGLLPPSKSQLSLLNHLCLCELTKKKEISVESIHLCLWELRQMGLRSSTVMAGIVLVLALAFTSEMSMVNAARFIVGDDKHWTFGYNYTDWAVKNAPFHVNDTLGKLHKIELE